MMGELSADMPLEVPPLIERVGLVTMWLGCDIEDACEPRFPDEGTLYEGSEFGRVRKTYKGCYSKVWIKSVVPLKRNRYQWMAEL